MSRLLVTVSRSWNAWATMRATLECSYSNDPYAVLVHGDNPRGDRDAAGMWVGLGGKVEAWPAKWEQHGDDCRCTDRRGGCRFAGMRRNLAMVESRVDMCLAFVHNASKGATHCWQAAANAGILTLVFNQGDPGCLVLNAIDSEVGL